MSAIPNEFLPEEIETRSPKNEWLFRPFLSSGEPFKSLLENNPWLAPPSLKKPLEWGTGGYWETTVGRKHSYWKDFNLPEGARKVPNGVFSCMELIYQDKFDQAKNCSENKLEIHSGYTIPFAMSLYYANEKKEAINLLNNLIKDPNEESFYVKALSASALTIFLFESELYLSLIHI